MFVNPLMNEPHDHLCMDELRTLLATNNMSVNLLHEVVTALRKSFRAERKNFPFFCCCENGSRKTLKIMSGFGTLLVLMCFKLSSTERWCF